jgi:hypothetical protein
MIIFLYNSFPFQKIIDPSMDNVFSNKNDFKHKLKINIYIYIYIYIYILNNIFVLNIDMMTYQMILVFKYWDFGILD